MTLRTCQPCGSVLTHTFVDLGMSPPCESYLAADQIDAGEMFYPLNVGTARQRPVLASPYGGLWQPMDTLKERAHLEQLYINRVSPWALWRQPGEPQTSDAMPLVVS
jgi:Putative zinc binding domain